MPTHNNKLNTISRRDFISKGSLASMGILLTGSELLKGSLLQEKPNSNFAGVQIGVITYSYRDMPGDLQQILQYVVNSGINAIELMGDAVEKYADRPASNSQVADWRATVSMQKFEEVRRMFKKAGVSIYAYKPNALGIKNTDAEIEYALKAAKALGAQSVTVELPKGDTHTLRLGTLAEKHEVYVGYHAHTQATDTAWDVALSQSPYNSMNLDCGHYIAAGGENTKESLLALIEAKHSRITSMHIKDRRNKDNGGKNMPWGQGDTPITEILNLLKTKKYKIPATVELEYDIPPGSDAVAEVKNCREFAKKALGA